MHIVPTHMTVIDYCSGLAQNQIVVNRDYQRSHEVWPVAAQSFLIESMLLGFPIPKMALYQITDRDARTSTREIVDGQQRTEAIKQFFVGALFDSVDGRHGLNGSYRGCKKQAGYVWRIADRRIIVGVYLD